MEHPEETWDVRIYNDLNSKRKSSNILFDLNLTFEQREVLTHKEWTL